jgi:ADP-heptose:LPS heptosyltransferase
VLTSHDALGYFGDSYGVTLLAPVGFSPDSEASAEQVAKLIDRIKAEGVKVYFVENSNDPRLIEQIARRPAPAPAANSTSRPYRSRMAPHRLTLPCSGTIWSCCSRQCVTTDSLSASRRRAARSACRQ